MPTVTPEPVRKVAYVMSRFPKLTETFVLDEMLEMQRQGVSVEIFPLWREGGRVVHAEAVPLVARANFLPGVSLEILKDVIYWVRAKPKQLMSALTAILTENFRSPRFLAGALVNFPKACTMARRMSDLKVAHVHAHFASHPAAVALVIGRLTGLSWSFTAHGSDLHREQAMLRSKVEEAEFVVAISEYNRRFITDAIGMDAKRSIHVVHCGVDVARFEPAQAAPDQFEIICIGRLHEVKGQRYLIEACARLSQRGIRWRCNLVGDGPDRKQLETVAERLGVADHVVFHGNCTRDQVLSLLPQMSAACAPSVPSSDGRREGIPVALIEAAATALPLVASRLSGIPELVLDNQTGLLTNPSDPADIAQALSRLAADPVLRQRFGQAAREHVSKEFSLERSIATLRRLMFEVSPACSR